MLKVALIILSSLLLSSCPREYNSSDQQFSQHKQFTYYRGELFTGIQTSRYPKGQIKSFTPFDNGLKSGTKYTWHKSGMLASERPYVEGKKHGIHRGWHDKGQKKFYYEFDRGYYKGETWKWFPNGHIAEYTLNDKGQELIHKKWRQSGTIFWNTVKPIDNTRAIFGLRGGGLCRKIEGKSTNENIISYAAD